MRLYRESSWSPFPSYEQTIEREREWRVHRSIYSARWWWRTGRSPLWYEGRLNVGSAVAQNDLLISTASQWRIGQLHEDSPDTTPTRKEPKGGLSQGEGCKPHGIGQRSGERCSLSHSRKLWWNDEGCRERLRSAFGSHCFYPWEANIPFDHTEQNQKFCKLEKFQVYLVYRNFTVMLSFI